MIVKEYLDVKAFRISAIAPIIVQFENDSGRVLNPLVALFQTEPITQRHYINIMLHKELVLHSVILFAVFYAAIMVHYALYLIV